MKATIAYFTVFVLLGIVTASLGPTLPFLADQTARELREVSILFTMRSLGYMIGSFLGGRLYDRFPGNPIMAAALLAIGGSLLLVPFSSALWVLTAVLFITGVGEGTLDVGGNTLLSWQHGEKVAPFMNGLHFFFGLGAFLFPLILAQVLAREEGVSNAYWLMGLLAFPAALGIARIRSPLRQRAADDDGRIPRAHWGLITLLVLFFCLYVGAEVSYAGWVFTYAVESGGVAAETAAYVTAVFWVAFTIARLISIPVGGWLRPRQILLIDVVGAMLSLVVLLARPGDLRALWLGSAGFGFFIASIFPTMITFAGRRMPVSGKVTGFFFLGATAGAMSLPWLIGQFFERVGPQFMMWALAADFLLAALVLAVLLRLPADPGKETAN